MSAERVLAGVAMLALGCVGVAGGVRMIALARNGVWVLPIDRERSLREVLVDLAVLLGMGVFLVEAVATALAPGWHRLDVPVLGAGLPWLALRGLGLPVAAAGVALYVLALRDFGLSWRFTIDRERPGALVTDGVFSHSRNPVYLALLLLALGIALLLGSPPLLGLACLAPLYFSSLIRREERFLVEQHGASYAQYAARVPRWLRWPARARYRRDRPD
jgi:protein-S-isoprenylcysteine O-methyltransferase Ste14